MNIGERSKRRKYNYLTLLFLYYKANPYKPHFKEVVSISITEELYQQQLAVLPRENNGKE